MNAIVPKHIDYSACPDCGAEFVEFGRETGVGGKVNRHVNGGVREYIRFACGRKDEYIPNFLKIKTEYPCQNTPDAVEQRRKRGCAKVSLTTAIRALDVDDDYRHELARNLGVRL
jgi:hypothetical protein